MSFFVKFLGGLIVWATNNYFRFGCDLYRAYYWYLSYFKNNVYIDSVVANTNKE